MQIGILKKPAQKEFSDMTRTEKKTFLACDLIERMIRIEQKVRGSMGEGVVPFYKTEYFKELKPMEKEKFTEYLKKKEAKKKWRFLPAILMIGSAGFIGTRITGNVVGGQENIPPLNLALLGIFLVAVIAYWIYVLSRRRRFKKLDKHFKVIENIIDRRKHKRNY